MYIILFKLIQIISATRLEGFSKQESTLAFPCYMYLCTILESHNYGLSPNVLGIFGLHNVPLHEQCLLSLSGENTRRQSLW